MWPSQKSLRFLQISVAQFSDEDPSSWVCELQPHLQHQRLSLEALTVGTSFENASYAMGRAMKSCLLQHSSTTSSFAQKNGKYMLMMMKTTKLKVSNPQHRLLNSTPAPTMLCQQCDDGGPVAFSTLSLKLITCKTPLQFHAYSYYYNVQRVCETL